jgi:NADH:ubiquinone oxidoreductase subunit E
MMMVDHRYYENLTPARVDEILDSIADAGGSSDD